MKTDIVETLRQPEYTGDNRCLPCTTVNLLIAGVVSLVLSWRSRLLGAVAFTLAAAVIYLRGYVVPGTPTLTKRYLPESVLALFGKEPEAPVASGFTGGVEAETDTAAPTESDTEQADDSDGAQGSTTNAIDPDALFLELGVLEPCANEDDLCLTDSFAERWSSAIDALEETPPDGAAVGESFGVETDGDEFSIEQHENGRTLRQQERIVGQWPSQAALLADVGAASALEAYDPAWDERSPQQKGQLLNGIRLFLEECPQDGGQIEYGQEVVESCCQSHDVLTVTCSESGDRLLEFPLDEIEA
ncbi:hypothetical protein [Halocatena halophila]|uniref:hypothetical protein n=1 Tax=Halocatena halophila TaxID=2814576 RepID=UPI002ED14F69